MSRRPHVRPSVRVRRARDRARAGPRGACAWPPKSIVPPRRRRWQSAPRPIPPQPTTRREPRPARPMPLVRPPATGRNRTARRFLSEGEHFRCPKQRTAPTPAWIHRQEWANGTVGSFGTSWSGWTQTAMAALGPEGLATMVANMSGADGHESSVRQGGALELRFLAWAFWHSAYNSQAALKAAPFVTPAALSAPRVRDWARRMPIRRGRPSSPWCRPTRRGDRDPHARRLRDYWKHPSVNPRATGSLPTSHPPRGGWYDSYTAPLPNFVGPEPMARPVRS